MPRYKESNRFTTPNKTYINKCINEEGPILEITPFNFEKELVRQSKKKKKQLNEEISILEMQIASDDALSDLLTKYESDVDGLQKLHRDAIDFAKIGSVNQTEIVLAYLCRKQAIK